MMKKKVGIITGTRAEYGLLKSIIAQLSRKCNLKIIATGMHLSPEFGATYKEIENDGFKIDEKVEILMSSDTDIGISKSIGIAIMSFSELYSRLNLDAIVILGDRFEILASAIAATVARIPIIHLYGGERTEGAYDEAFRHSITKMSHLHFTSTEEYKNRVIQLGEEPSKVFNVGSLGVSNIKNIKLLSKEELQKHISFSLEEDYVVVTFHPVTLEGNSSEMQVKELIKVLKEYNTLNYLITKCNADSNGRVINKLFEEFASENNDNVMLVDSLGQLKYLSAVKYCSMVLGNSSSGIIEAPSFKKPTINIGDRQKGRTQADSIINCQASYEEIKKAMKQVIGMDLRSISNPYEKNNTVEIIINEIDKFLNSNISIKKTFYDIK